MAYDSHVKQPERISEFATQVMAVVRSIPRGRVASYGQVAWLAGYPGAARHVGWILHSSSQKHGLPWQRVIGAAGKISLMKGCGFEEQRRLLIKEGVAVTPLGRVDLRKFLWEPSSKRLRPRSIAAAVLTRMR
jgi:methylated-DNA-protein-cysteine methyltransferase-like protein